MHTFYKPYPHKYQWTKDHPMEHIIGDPLKPGVTRGKLAADQEMCFFSAFMSDIEPKTVKEAMPDFDWI